MGQTYTGASLEQALADGGLVEPRRTLLAAVAPSAQAGHVRVSVSGGLRWIEMPIDMIESAEHLDQYVYRGETAFPLMRISLHQQEDPKAQALAALVVELSASRGGGVVPVGHVEPLPFEHRIGRGHFFTAGHGPLGAEPPLPDVIKFKEGPT